MTNSIVSLCTYRARKAYRRKLGLKYYYSRLSSKWWKLKLLPAFESVVNALKKKSIQIPKEELTSKLMRCKSEFQSIEYEAACRIQSLIRGCLCRSNLAKSNMLLDSLGNSSKEITVVQGQNSIENGGVPLKTSDTCNNLTAEQIIPAPAAPVVIEAAKQSRMPTHLSQNLTVVTNPLKGKSILEPIIGESNSKGSKYLELKSLLYKKIKIASKRFNLLKEDVQASANEGAKEASVRVSNALIHAKESSNEFIKSQYRVQSRISRRSNCEGGMQDAVLFLTNGNAVMHESEMNSHDIAEMPSTITSLYEFNKSHYNIANSIVQPSPFPVIHRKWYISSYPHIRNNYYEVDAHTNGNTMMNASKYMNAQGYPDRSSRLTGECVRSILKYPFSLESLQQATMTMHLTDYHRYDYIEYVIYMEAYFDPHADVNHLQTGAMDSVLVGELRRQYVPIFQSSCQLTNIEFLPDENSTPERLPVFAPYGGRMHLLFTPNVIEIAGLVSQQVAKELIHIANISFMITLAPIAMPSSNFLSTFLR